MQCDVVHPVQKLYKLINVSTLSEGESRLDHNQCRLPRLAGQLLAAMLSEDHKNRINLHKLQGFPQRMRLQRRPKTP